MAQGGKPKHRVVIIGGGFGGLYAAKSLRYVNVELTLIDRNNFHLFQPLLYQVATGGLSPADITSPLRAVLHRQRNASVIKGEVVGLDLGRRTVSVERLDRPGADEFAYDSLIVAAGSANHYFGHNDWEATAPGLKSIEEALKIRHKILAALEAAERCQDPDKRDAYLTFVVIGGGATGVELAGAIAEIAFHTAVHDFRNFDPRVARILLVEGNERVLPVFDDSLSARARKHLEAMGVEVHTGAFVSDIIGTSVTLHKGDTTSHVNSHTILWAAGVKASPIARWLANGNADIIDRQGRVKVSPDLTLPGHPNVFVIGDLANYSHQTGEPLPGLAPVAMQQGRYVARLIAARLKGKSRKPFRYLDKGNLATIGRNRAVGVIRGLKVSGRIAWLVWLFIHLMYLVEFQNRLLVFIQWLWNYITLNRGARIIVGETPTRSTKVDEHGK